MKNLNKKYLIIIAALLFYSLNANADRWYIISENNLNGSVVVELLWAGTLDYRNNNGDWVRIIKVNKHDAEDYTVNSAEDVEISWIAYNCEVCDPGTELYVAWRPPDGHYNQMIQLRFIDYDHDKEVSYKTIQAYRPGRLENIQVSNGKYCGEVHLSWNEKPDNVNSILHNLVKTKVRYDIYRDSVPLVSTTETTFIDYNVEPGEEYYYQVRYNIMDCLPQPDPWTWEDNHDVMDDEGTGPVWDDAFGEKSHPLIGSSKSTLKAPVYVADPENTCGDSIILEWHAYEDTANDNTIQQFLVQRATNINFTTGLTEFNVYNDSTVVEYTDNVPLHNTEYYYRVKTKNMCGDLSETWSDIVHGKALTTPQAPSNFTASYNGNGIELNWNDNSEAELYSVIHRSPEDIAREIPMDGTSYIDKQFSPCIDYTYTVAAWNSCGSSGSDSVRYKMTPNPADLFDSTSFEVSKGYFPDKTELTWDNSNYRLVDFYEITRYPDTVVFNVNSQINKYIDKSVIAGKLYTYTIQAKLDCVDEIIASPIGNDVGFRLKAGVLTGQVEYEDGVAVEDVQVLVEPSDNSIQVELDKMRASLEFDGNDYVTIPHSSSQNISNNFTMQMWVYPDTLTGNQYLLEKVNGDKGFGMVLDSSDAKVWLKNGSATYTAIAANSVVPSEYMHIAGSYDGNYLRIYLNGEIIDSTEASGSVNNTGSIYIGADASLTGFFTGNIDEVLLWNTAKTSREIARDYSRILSGTEKGLVAYWRFDINEGNHVFDYSKPDYKFNKNHGNIFGAQWSAETPSSVLLALKGLTDRKGNYVISYIQYYGSGNIFNFTPYKGQHLFETEADKLSSLYVGEGALYNTLDFTDKSSVKVTGTIQYKESRCMAKDIGVYIDGNPVIRNGEIVTTDKEGYFEIRVPSIGNHSVSVNKKGHVFAPGIWPTDSSLYSFVEPVSGIEFIDNTRIKVVGRVVGGKREQNKKPALGLSKNNLGKARIIFKSQLGFGCSTDTVFTNPNTGEYEINLLPLNYVIEDIEIIKNPAIDFGTQEVLFLDSYKPVLTVYDTVYTATGNIARINSAKYQVRRDFIYRTPPRIIVTNENDNPFMGEESITLQDTSGNEYELDLKPSITGFPVFFAGEDYTARIFIHEEYINADNNDVDLVPLKNAIIRINNDIELIEGETGSTVIIQLEDEEDGDTLYTFTAGEPNFLLNTTYPEYNFTKSFKIEAEVESISTEWEPGNSGEGDEYFRGYVLGRKAIGNSDFVSAGSSGELPLGLTILRDPPGDQSRTYLEKGSVFTTSQIIQKVWNAGIELNLDIDIAPNTEVDLPFGGPDISTGSDAGPFFGLGATYKGTDVDKDATTYIINEKISTSGAPELVGASEDLFIGSTHNYSFGTVNYITLIPDSLCQQSGGPCNCSDSALILNEDVLRIGLKNIYTLIDSVKSTFIYTQDHIMNYLIPALEKLRNNLFIRSEAYTSNIPVNHPYYGTNNDDPVWGDEATSESPFYETGDSDGPSYTYRGSDDSIRWYNQKIRLWKELLELNEKEKKLALSDKNISFEGGGSGYEYQYSIKESESGSTTHGFNIEISGGFNAGFKAMGMGFKLTMKVSGGYGMSWEDSEDEESSVTYGYSLADDDQGDYFSVDIMQPASIDDLKGTKQDALTGPVFKTIAGRSLCPWEGPVTTNFYEPIGSEISAGTMQREKPQLSITPNIQNNIPPDEAAIYKLTIGNASETNETMWYTLRVVENSNPHGAQISMDGKAVGRIFEIPGGESYEKSLTLKRTPGIDNYEDIQLILYSPCEWNYHTNGGVLHAVDTISFSAYFIPSCTEITLYEPDDQWVMNTTRNDTLPIIVGEYDRNYRDFKKFQVQYKEASSSKWIGLKSYWNDTSGLDATEITPISDDQSYTLYPWDISQIPDGLYDIRAVSFCPLSNNYSPVLRGIMDRIPPHSFGSPQPADGILSPNDEMLITFNENIHTGMLTYLNFDIRGILNGSELVHSASILFDGENDYVRIPSGIILKNKSFTIECWLKRKSTGEEYIFSQGNTQSEALYIGFNQNDQLIFGLGDTQISTEKVFTDSDWHHYAFIYNHENKSAQIYYDGSVAINTNMNKVYTGGGEIILGRLSFNEPSFFTGNMHELRIWGLARSQSELVSEMNRKLAGKEFGLIGNWPMNEAFGILAKDIAHHRNATIYADWDVFPSGFAYNFNGNEDYLRIDGREVSFNEKTDFTIEFWFKAKEGNNITFVSNGKGDATDKNKEGWNIGTDSQGRILIKNNTIEYTAVTTNYFDNDWHHFALTVDRMGNTHTYIDGEIQSINNSIWSGFGGPFIWIGARGWYENFQFNTDQFFNGQMDEIRIWKLARKQNQVKRYMNSRLKGDEPGLWVYYPFETYKEDAGVMVLKECIEGQAVIKDTAVSYGETGFTNITPNIILNRPVEKVNFNYSHKEDKIILWSIDELKRIENCILDITVSNVQDLNGNPMQSPETWTAFIDLGQIRWKNQEINIEKELNKPLSFSAEIENQSGTQQNYLIRNLPVWLTTDQESGTIPPISTKEITFTISEGLNIGKYSEDIYLYTEFEFDESMVLNLRVYKTPPKWEINPADYVYTMNVVGQLYINHVISDDTSDMVAAFVNNQCRGVANIEYVKGYDMYEVFLDIYSNTKVEENTVLRVWDASKGRQHIQVNPQFDFQANDMVGSPSSPIIINATDTVYETIPLKEGWNWISFNLISPVLGNVDSLLRDINVPVGYEIKGQSFYDQYDEETGWVGSLTESGGIRNEEMYMIHILQPDSINYIGLPVVPEEISIPLEIGWNWIGFTPNQNMEVNDALANLNPANNDIVKGQMDFAVYDEKLGWIGSLEYLKPNNGYMMYANKNDTLIYPNEGLLSFPRPTTTLKSGKKEPDYSLMNYLEPYPYPFNMSLIARLNNNQGISICEKDILVAMGQNNCLGISSPSIRDDFEQPVFFITVLNDPKKERVQFKYYSYYDNNLYNIIQTIDFEPDKHLGTINKPIELQIGDALNNNFNNENYLIYPNPFSDMITISLYKEIPGDFNIKIYDMLSRQVYFKEIENAPEGWNSISWNGNDMNNNKIVPGIYVIKIQSGSQLYISKIIFDE